MKTLILGFLQILCIHVIPLILRIFKNTMYTHDPFNKVIKF